MARIGINPARGKRTSYSPEKVTVALLTYIPHFEGYFQNRFSVLKLSLASILANTIEPYDLLVFDNGSHFKVVNYLQELHKQGIIRYLFLSKENLGKIGAFKLLFNAAPGEYVAYADDDIYYYPGWLGAHMKIIENFPQVGMVSGSPVRDASGRANKAVNELIGKQDASIKFSYERRVPDEWEIDWAISVGRDPETHLQSTIDYQDVILECNGIEAFGSASHFQFIAPKDVITGALPETWSGKLMGEMNELDQAVDELGYLRLSTVERYSRHLGNSISPDLSHEAKRLGINNGIYHRKKPIKKHWLLKFPGSGRILRQIYNYLFKLLNQIE